jgi:hypothetical protein
VSTNPFQGTYYSAGTIQYAPLLFTKKVMYLFTEQLILNEITNNDYEGEISGKGDKVIIRVAPTTIPVNDYEPNESGGIDYTTAAPNSRNLPIDYAVVAAFVFDEIDKVQSDLSLMNIYAEKAAYSLNRDTSQKVLAVMGDGAHADNKGASAGKISEGYDLGSDAAPLLVTATNALDKIVDLGTVLDEYDVPMEGRFIVLPAWFCNFLKKGDLKAADVTGDNTGVIRTGLIGEIDNFMVYKSNLLAHETNSTVSSGTPECFFVVAGVKDATTFASQVTKTETVVAESSFGEKWRSLLVYGRKVIQPEALAMLYCTKDTYTA